MPSPDVRVGAVVTVLLLVALATSFAPPQTCRRTQSIITRTTKQKDASSKLSPLSSSWFDEAWQQAGKFWDELTKNSIMGSDARVSASVRQCGEEDKEEDTGIQHDDDNKRRKIKGVVVRAAARAFDGEASKPSSRRYTTKKDAFPVVSVTAQGVDGDYNHYRTQALKGTPDRAVSILTTDVMNYVRTVMKHPDVVDGDLGENLLVDGVEYHDIKVGDRYQIGESVQVVITEPIEPCANLCTLPYINDPSLPPLARIERCNGFIKGLDVQDGLRGWYAKVSEPGTIKLGDELRPALF